MSALTAIESAAVTLRAHVYSPVPRDTACCCGWDYGWQRHDRERAHARHAAEQLAAVGALGGAGEVAIEWGIRWPDEHNADVEEARDRVHAEKVAWQEQGEVVQREIRTGPWKRVAS